MTVEFELDKQQQFSRYFNKALAHHANNHLNLAIELYRKALNYNPSHLPTIQVLALLFENTSQYDKALTYYKLALVKNSHSPNLHYSIASCYDACLQLNKAKYHYEQAINLRQDYAEAYNNHGNVCRKLGEYQIAEESLFRALRLYISIETLANIGLLMAELRKHDLALSYYNHALQIEPDNASVQWNKALLLLSQGFWRDGWKLYDYGIMAKTRPKQISQPDDSINDYSLDYFRDKTLFIHREQGIGDEIMFASCFRELISVTKKCYIEADTRLVNLFQRAFPTATIVPHSELLISSDYSNEELADIHLSSASIPRYIRNRNSDFPYTKGYLQAIPSSQSHWTSRFNALGDGVKIGISWRGGIGEQSIKRSAELQYWKKIFNHQNCQFINLQYGHVEDELNQFDTVIHEWIDTDHFHNIEELAAQISALDLVITVSNITAHLAGALGKPVWIILPYAANWRWLNGKNPSVWYPSARLFCQRTPGEWNSVFDEVSKALVKLNDSHQSPNKRLQHA